MSTQLSQEDKMLLGEVDLNGNAVNRESAADYSYVSNQSDGNEDNGLIATAGKLVPVDRAGDKIDEANEEAIGASIAATDTISKKRGASASVEAPNDQNPITAKRSPTKKAKVDTDGALDQSEEPKTPSPKKRTSPKKKASVPTIKAEAAEDDEEVDHQEPVTPSPKKRSPTKKSGKGETDKSISPTKVGGTTVRDTPRQRAAPSKALAAPRGIPTSWETAGDVDKMLVSMKEKGEDWNAIREAWKEATGQETANSTLPNRYARIRVNMAHLKDGDIVHLLTAKKEVDAEFWANVASSMEAKGSEKYPTAFLQKKFKALEDEAAAAKMNLEAYIETLGDAAKPSSNADNNLGGHAHAIDGYVLVDGEDVVGSD